MDALPGGGLLKDARARVRDVRRDVVGPPVSLRHATLTPEEREAVQDWMAKRYLQLHDRHVGRRRTDLPMPASVKSSSQIERFAKYLRKAKP
jgi:hypothetical protein